mmetsp:Transcript_8230/g.11112  ORF Transcript_8230/g.11112 Transcript_8230/m.11112 type:complete len:1016 (+) Transcript_8230:214-3261(+)
MFTINKLVPLKLYPTSCQLRSTKSRLDDVLAHVGTHSSKRVATGKSRRFNSTGPRCALSTSLGSESSFTRSSTTFKVGAIRRMSVTPKLKSSSIETNATTDVSDLPDHEPTLNARLVTLAKFFGSGVLILAVFHFNDVASGIVWSFKHFQVIFSILAKTCISPSMQQVSELQTALASYVGGSVAGISQTLADWVTIEANTVLSLWTNFTTYISKLGYIASFALAVLAAAALLYFRQQWKESVQDVVHRKAASSAPKSKPMKEDEKVEYAGLWNFNSSVRVSAPKPAQVKETSKTLKLVESLTSSKDSKPIKLTSEQRSMLQDRVSTLWNFEGVSSEGIRQATPQDASVFLSIMTDEELVIAKSKLEDEVRGLWNFGTPVLTDVERVQDKKESAMKAQVAELWDFQRASSVGLRSEVVKLPLVSKSDLSPVEIERLEKEVAVLWDFTPQVIDNEEYEKFVAKMRRRNVPNPVVGVAGGFEDSKSGWLKSFIAGQLGGSKVPRQQQLTSNQRQELQNEISILWNFEQVSDKGEVKMKNRDVSSFLNVMSDEELALAREKLEQEVRGLWNFDVRVKTDTEQRVAEERADLEEKVSLLWDFKTPEQAEKDKAAASINQMQLAKEAEEERKRKLNAMVNAKRLKQAQLEDAAMQERLARKESSNRKAVDAMWDFQIVSTKGDKPPVVNSVGIFSSPSVQSATLSEEDKKESEEHSAGVWAFETVKSDGQKQSERVAADQEEFSSILWDFKPVSDVSSSPAALQKKKQGTPTGRLNLDDQLLQKTEADSLWNFEIPKSVGNMMEVKTPTPQSKVYSSKFNLGQTESDAMLKAQREEYAETLNMGTPVSSAMGKGKVEPKSGGVLSKETMEFKTDMSDEEKDQQKLEVADLWKFDVVKSEREKKAAKIVAEHKASSAIWNSKSVSTEDKPKDNPKSDSSSGWLGRVFSASKNSPKSDLTNKEKQKLKDDTAELWNFEEVKNKDMEKEMTGSKVETSSGASPDLLKVKSESVVVSDSFGKNGK